MGAFWIPILETPTSAGGNNNVYVVASNALSATPQPVSPVTSNASLLAIVNQTGGAPAAPTYGSSVAIIAATGSDGNTHLYGLDLANTASLPVPTQLGSLSLSSGRSICSWNYAQQSQTNPASLFVVVEVTSAAGQCGSSTDQFFLVNYTDTPTTAPLSVSFGTTDFSPIYQADGQLGGVVLVNANSTLVFYPANTLGTTTPGTVVPTAYSFEVFAKTAAGAYVVVNGTSAALSPESLWLVSPSGGANQVYTGGLLGGTVLSGALVDANNLYFTDTNAAFTSVLYKALSLSTNTSTTLYAANVTNGSSVSLIGLSGSKLLFTVAGSGGDSIAEIPISGQSTAPTTVVTLTGAHVGLAFLDPSNSYLFINELTGADTANAVAVQLSNGQEILTASNGLFFPYGGNASSVVLVAGFTSNVNGYGGATVYDYQPAAASKTALTLANGAPYTLPSVYSGEFYALSSGGIGAAMGQIGNTATPSLGALYDLSKNIIVPITPNDTSVSVPY